MGGNQRGEPIQDLNPIPKKWALIMGSEAHGLSSEAENVIDRMVAIPSVGYGESLNVGVATGILLHYLTQ